MNGKQYRTKWYGDGIPYHNTHIESAYNAGKSLSGRTYEIVDIGGQPPRMAQLIQLMRVTFDGDLIDKSTRTELVNEGLAQRYNGWNWITAEGIKKLEKLKLIHP